MSIFLSGSVAFDRIMTFPGHFEDHILPEKLHILNVSFMVDRIEERRGGTAGNIAYNLALLGENPCLYASVGHDFTNYGAALKKMGVNLDGVRVLEENFTACAYITTDSHSNQITGFAPSAMNTAVDPANYPHASSSDWAIVSPGNMDDMRMFPRIYREKGTPFIFDPGQQIVVLSAEDLLNGIDGAAILVGNDYEISMISTKTGLSKADLIEKVGCLITTFGAEGSEIAIKDVLIHIDAVPVSKVADPTGAGDAYRAGLVKGLAHGATIEDAARMGAVCASFCIEKYGTQEHFFTKDMFVQLYEKNFGSFPVGIF